MKIDKNIYFIPTKLDGTPLLDTSNVTNMNYMFSGCSNLRIIPQLNTSNVTTMRNMFNVCTNLTEIPELDTSNATKLLPYKQKFYGDTSARGWANIGIRQDEVGIKKRKENREAKEFKIKEEMINELTGGNKSSKGGKVF